MDCRWNRRIFLQVSRKYPEIRRIYQYSIINITSVKAVFFINWCLHLAMSLEKYSDGKFDT